MYTNGYLFFYTEEMDDATCDESIMISWKYNMTDPSHISLKPALQVLPASLNNIALTLGL